MVQQLELMSEVSAANWLKESILDWSAEEARLRSLLPPSFPAYGRLLFPIPRRLAGGGLELLRWSTVALWTGRVLHPQVQFERLIQPIGHDVVDEALIQCLEPGDLGTEAMHALVEILRESTSTPTKCWFCMWDGYGIDPVALEVARGNSVAARVKLPHRDYLLFQGPIEAVHDFGRWPVGEYPNVWWPDDRSWCVASDIDLFDTFVGGSSSCIRKVLHHPWLEALPASPETRIDLDGDTLNL